MSDDDKIERTAKKLGLRIEALRILLHTLGIQKRNGWSVGGWRNYYNADEGADSCVECKILAVGGWMIGQRLGDGWTFSVTEAGRAALRCAGWRIDTGKQQPPAE